MSDYARWFRDNTPGSTVRYFPYTQGQQVIDYIKSLPRNVNVTVVGHSYGADTAGTVVMAVPGRVSTLITIDPVGGDSRTYLGIREAVPRWINVQSVGGSRLEPSNAVAGLDVVTGGAGPWDRGPYGKATYFYEASVPHGYFSSMMEALCMRPEHKGQIPC